ncbi:MAG: hybrid sensor histidine kinase/response regulator [Burkholderiales bacterium]|nr:hybrid sensor histidine kinase/response regulator [Opitutaceae bacterium]
MDTTTPAKTVVLVVDDLADSRFLMRCSLLANGYEVVEAASGSEALDLVMTVNPDVMVMDVCMPGMSGYDVCRAIRARAETCKLPLILVSAVADRSAVALGFASGAVDFLSKPFRAEELCARVAVHAELNRARRLLEESHARLAELNREKDLMFGMAAHDLRGPIAVIMGFAENALGLMRGGESRPERQALEVILRESEHMEHFLGTLLDLNALERGGQRLKLRETDIESAARSAVERAEPAAARKSLALRLVLAQGLHVVRADASGVRRILDNLISNALKFTPSGGRVTVRVSEHEREAQCVVSDSGPGLTGEDMEQVFTRFARLSAKPTAGEKSTGLGLAICRALAEGMGGRVWCGNNPEGGAFFGFAIPVPPCDAPEASVSPFVGLGVDGSGHSVSPFPHLLAHRTRT